ncbi:hypothetical protein BH23THE1_BH23THE1_21300 [soil metagenome]
MSFFIKLQGEKKYQNYKLNISLTLKDSSFFPYSETGRDVRKSVDAMMDLYLSNIDESSIQGRIPHAVFFHYHDIVVQNNCQSIEHK